MLYIIYKNRPYLIQTFICFRFYLESLVPEIVDPAFGHRLMISDIRETNSNIIKTVKKKLFK